MKRKMLALGCFSLFCVALFAGESQAWHHHHRYVTHITCRPYNAFTPICWGNLYCDGCCPSPCGVAGGGMPMTMGMPPWASGPAGWGMQCANGYCGGATASDMSPKMAPSRPMPFTPPMPMPIGPNTTMYPPGGVAQANYPMYAPQYYPYYMPTYATPYMGWPAAQPMPYYWNGYGR
jgi:hypothetical protein